MDELKHAILDPGLSYYIPTVDPLSANVVLAEGREYLWVFDVGAHPDIPKLLKTETKPLRIILSHFHPDHCSNLDSMDFADLFLGKNTYRYVKQGQIVESDLFFSDGDLKIHIFPIPSSHAKGSLALEVNNTYSFLGDAAYATKKDGKTVYNAGLLKEQIRILSELNSPYVLLSHQEPFQQTRQEVLSFLKEIYATRKTDQAYIEV